MTQVLEIYDGGIPDLDVDDSRMTRRFLVTEVPNGGNPYDHPSIPVRGSSYNFFGDVLYCSGLRATRINDNDYHVDASYSEGSIDIFDINNGTARAWSLTYKKVAIPLPIFVRSVSVHAGGSSPRWIPVPRDLDIEFMVLNVSVSLEGLGNAGIRDLIDITLDQVGKIHVFSGFPTRQWRMLPPTIANAPDTRRRISVAYSWESDPGNGAVDSPPETPERPFVPVVPPARPPFHNYIVVPGQEAGARPRIETISMYPNTVGGLANPFVQPDGWRSLPGNPI